jgi:hypothetical protein
VIVDAYPAYIPRVSVLRFIAGLVSLKASARRRVYTWFMRFYHVVPSHRLAKESRELHGNLDGEGEEVESLAPQEMVSRHESNFESDIVSRVSNDHDEVAIWPGDTIRLIIGSGNEEWGFER